jgi:hypothetical protein
MKRTVHMSKRSDRGVVTGAADVHMSNAWIVAGLIACSKGATPV